MKITMPKQFQDFLKSIGLSIENILEQAGIPNILWKEEIQLSTEEYYLFLKKIDEVITDEQISAISNIDNLNVFIPSFFAALSSKNGLEGLKRLAKYKKLIGPVLLEIKEFEEIVQVQYFFEQREKELPRFAVLNEQLMLINLLNKGIGKKISPVSVTSPFEYGELLIKEINATINKAKQNEIIFSMKDLKKLFLTANNIMVEYLEPQLKQKLSEMERETFETFKQSSEETFSAYSEWTVWIGKCSRRVWDKWKDSSKKSVSRKYQFQSIGERYSENNDIQLFGSKGTFD